MAQRETIVEVFAFIGGAYGSKWAPPTATDMTVWERLVGHIPDEDLVEATVAHCSTETWPPTPADLLKRCEHRRIYRDRAHRPMELTEGETTARTASTKALLDEVRGGLGNVVNLDERRQA